MERIDRILQNQLFRENVEKNEAAEVGRHFCRHDMGHFLDVARIAWILNLEEGLGISKEWIYGTALLHDIGRHDQYAKGEPHQEAGARRAPGILRACGFSEQETREIVAAIRSHRDGQVAGESSLRGLLYRADKASRACFCCKAREQCNWKEDRKNISIRY